jgi:hypothetical protein
MTIFLLVNGLNGGSTDPDHPGWFELSSANMGVGAGVSNGVIRAGSGNLNRWVKWIFRATAA